MTLRKRFLHSLGFGLGLWCQGGLAGPNDVQVGGFVSAGYLDSSHYSFLADTEGGTTSFVEGGVHASWTAKDRLTVNGQLFAFELGPYGNFEPLVDYLFVDYNVKRAFGVRAGRIKRELGIFYHVQDIDFSRTAVLLPVGVYDQRIRDISASLDGLSAYGNLDLWEGAYLDYTVYAGYIDLKPDGGVAGFIQSELSKAFTDLKVTSLESKYNHGMQLWLSPGIDNLRVGIGSSSFLEMSSTLTGHVPEGYPAPLPAGTPLDISMKGFDMRIAHASLEYFVGTFGFFAEYAVSSTNHNYYAVPAGMQGTYAEREAEVTAWYLSASKRFGRFEAAVTHVDNRNASDNEEPVRPMAKISIDNQFSLRYDVTDFWTLKAEIHSIEGTRQLFNQFNQNPILDETSWTLFAAKSTFFF